MQKLQSMIENISLVDYELNTMSIQEFVPFEQRLGYKLPDDYKYFCQTLGAGTLAELFDVFCINNNSISDNNDITSEMIERIRYGMEIREQIRHSGDEEDPYPNRNDTEYISLLQSALIFASFNGEQIFFWDLRSYRDFDDSYDIYWHVIDTPDADEPIKICRKFSDFICEFCYGQLVCDLIPNFCAQIPREIIYTFCPWRQSTNT